jgi:hypothetical protein
MAHDYYQLDMEEEGDRFIDRAEKLYPGYFRGPIFEHAEKDADYCQLVRQLQETLGLEIMKAFGFDDEQI